MKPVFFTLFLALFFSIANAQDYKITLVDHKDASGKIDRSAKAIPFVITLRDTTLRSSSDGVLYISKALFEQRKDCMVREFSFYNSQDGQKYSEPRFTRTIRKLGDYCEEGILVAEKKMAGE